MFSVPAHNRALLALSDADQVALQAFLVPVNFSRDDVLQEAGAPVQRLWFPRHGLIALLTPIDGTTTATGWVDCRGVVGAEAPATTTATQSAVVEVGGGGHSMSADDARRLSSTRPGFAALLHRSSAGALVMAAQMAACGRFHVIGQQVAACLLLAHDGSDGGPWQVTHQHIARLLSVRRSTVTVIVEQMRDLGTLTYTRGRVQVLDRAKLSLQACTCMIQEAPRTDAAPAAVLAARVL